jgi:hypothetical protein
MKIKPILLISFILLALFISSCGSGKKVKGEKLDGVLYSMKRGSCFGKCPVFDLQIMADGTAKLDAKKYNKINGKLEKKLSAEELAVLGAAFKNAELAKLDTVYPSLAEDLPLTILGQNIDGSFKKVRGNESMPDSYYTVTALMEGITRSEGWVIKEKYPEEVETETRETKPKEDMNIYDEIIIEPSQNIRLAIWLKDMEKYGVTLKTKIEGATNLWVIKYDRTQYEPYFMLDMLKKDPGITSAEFNKKVEPRGN